MNTLEKLSVLSESAQIQRRNIEMALNAYGLFTKVKGSAPELTPLLPQPTRDTLLEVINEELDRLRNIDRRIKRLLDEAAVDSA